MSKPDTESVKAALARIGLRPFAVVGDIAIGLTIEHGTKGEEIAMQANIYRIEKPSRQWLPGRPVAEITRQDSTDAEFLAIVTAMANTRF